MLDFLRLFFYFWGDSSRLPVWTPVLGVVLYLTLFGKIISAYGLFRLRKWAWSTALVVLSVDFSWHLFEAVYYYISLYIVEQITIVWSDYIKYRAGLRGFELHEIESILRYSVERYFDTTTHRRVVIGKAGDALVMIPYKQKEDAMVPVTIHATTRQQITFRLKTGMFTND